MYTKKQIPLRMDLEVFEQVRTRAENRGISINEWLNRAIIASLTAKTGHVKVTHTETYEL